MAFIVKNSLSIDTENVPVKQQPLIKVEKVEQKAPEVTVESPKECVDCYKHVHDGDLHKMYNTKSDYLMDMLFKD